MDRNALRERLPPTLYMIANFAHEITGRKPGKNCASRWLNKHPNALISRYSPDIDRNRKRADCAWSYALYLELINRNIEQYNLQPNQIYNMDEKGFAIGIMTSQKRVFSRRLYEKKFKQFLQDGNREWITTIACIRADGTVISPVLIYMAKSGHQGFIMFLEETQGKKYQLWLQSTGLVPFSPEVVLQRFNEKSESRPSSASSTASILLPEEWRDIRKLLRKIGGKNPSKDFKMLSNTVMELTTEVILLRLQLERAEKALLNEKRRRIRKRPLLLGLPNENEGGAIFFSFSKIQQARELQQQREDQARRKEPGNTIKSFDNGLQRKLQRKKSKKRLKPVNKSEKDACKKLPKKQRQKLEEKLAKQANLQLQKDIIATTNPRKSRTNPNSRKLKRKQSSEVEEEVIDEVLATNRREQ
ncbi:conserved hypothetical protein [Talaromyces stipitatus ATCC 10500]|uniref:DDE-1 domain-containing protein n=1 Tax=Talaromyces stipitatus (strain ATCC 10500 / CBS 375.48 / QM 6759 / NRRL 1006) TaxID=441959 RepID=B8LYZ7_TALSN|nr:uncharacterized protein TSTA_069260 [Talaromyces stipitatus ATCC 10500]EED23505.1 conserved hypothetical protein [Talaromyces stipitatus ATCC 10500]